MEVPRARKFLIVLLFVTVLFLASLSKFVPVPDTIFVDSSELFTRVVMSFFAMVVGFSCLMSSPIRYAYGGLGFSFFLVAYSFSFGCLLERLTEEEPVVVAQGALYYSLTVAVIFRCLEGFVSLWQLALIAPVAIIFRYAGIVIYEHNWGSMERGRGVSTHFFGGVFGLGVSAALHIVNRKREKAERRNAKAHALPCFAQPGYVGDQFAIMGSLVLWVFFPILSLGTLSDDAAAFEVLKFLLLVSSCTFSSVLFSAVLSGGASAHDWKLDPHVLTSAPVAAASFYAATAGTWDNQQNDMIAGFVVGTFCVIMSTYLSPFIERRLGIRDTAHVLSFHVLPSLLGSLAVVVYDFVDNESKYATPLLENVIMLVLAAVFGLVIGFVVSRLDRVRAEVAFDDGENWTGFAPRDIPTPAPVE
eukprot:gnl/Chilomastix_cuspidata/802.p2 GENE.gnl/Chilomastix_cuspidata/802~~gnl/Chilomastix_cuspidata/802.p2  ORF type:complete len:417 (+),score=184.19 gnl/Chilomastix_cuspidata/802:101-1351(+)